MKIKSLTIDDIQYRIGKSLFFVSSKLYKQSYSFKDCCSFETIKCISSVGSSVELESGGCVFFLSLLKKIFFIFDEEITEEQFINFLKESE